MGVVLTMTMVMITSIAITRERERGTIENLLATLAQPLEVMLGKIIPYIIVGYIQILLMLILIHYVFIVPIGGSIITLCLAAMPFIAANLAVGLAFSAVAKNQLQSTQMTIFFFLPSILLSGFMFPFRGMPGWAQIIGEGLPLTHFLRIVRGILLKGYTWGEVWANLWPILFFMVIAITVGVKSYRKTLD
jgi:ABC-2 type transport system permease protein